MTPSGPRLIGPGSMLATSTTGATCALLLIFSVSVPFGPVLPVIERSADGRIWKPGVHVHDVPATAEPAWSQVPCPVRPSGLSMPRLAFAPPSADEMIVDVILFVVSSRMILNDWSEVGFAQRPTFVHESTKRRFGATPIVWYFVSPGSTSRSSQ